SPRHLAARRRIDGDARLNVGADARVAAVAFELGDAVRAGREQREHAAGRVAGDHDLVRVDVDAAGVRPRPADRGLRVVKLRGPRRLALQPIRAGDVRIAELRERSDVVDDVLRGLVAGAEAAAEKMDDRGPLRRHAVRGPIDVEQELLVAALAEDDIALDAQIARA